MLSQIARGKGVVMSELEFLDSLKFDNADLSLAVGQEKYHYNLCGWPIRKKSKNGRILIKM